MKTSEVRDMSVTSDVKGEVHRYTLKTFAQYIDMIIIRHPDKKFYL